MMDHFSGLRAAAGFTVEEIAREFGFAPGEVAAWDAGLCLPPAKILRSLETISAFGGTSSGMKEASLRVPEPQSYLLDVGPNHRKRLGQVFTPASVAALMADWIVTPTTKTVLDPALGTGNLARAVLARKSDMRFTGVEIDSVVLQYIEDDLAQKIEIINGNALTLDYRGRFDGIIMNPPYIRHRELKGHDSIRHKVSCKAGLVIPKSANLYVDFVVEACTLLSDGGRGAFLIPAEWMSANFSAGLKQYLLENSLLRGLVTFSHCSSVFDGALTTASVLLVEKGQSVDHVRSHFLQSVSSDQSPHSLSELEQQFPARIIPVNQLNKAAKWEPLLKGDRVETPQGWTTLGEIARTSRGIATGSNSFFLISDERLRYLQVQEIHAKPCVGRATDVPGLIFEASDFEALRNSNANIWLLDFSTKLNTAEEAYVAAAEVTGLQNRYLLKCRLPWYSMERREPAPVWAGVFGRGDLRFVYNAAGVRSLTNFHCVIPKFDGVSRHKALVVLLNCRETRELMTAHRRGYGGGLAKFEPNDLKAIPVPDLRFASDDLVRRISDHLPLMDQWERNESSGMEMQKLIEELQTQVREATEEIAC